MSHLIERLRNYDRTTAAKDMVEAAYRIERLEAALLPAKNTLNAVRVLMKNQDRRTHEQRIYEAVQICCEITEDALDPSSPPSTTE
jgi:hypothetical protein